ncbi:MAG: hypothetical protein IT428_06750 [Planctomycetaceae bacterium]|nr:hypothetical protein [Planctomycetaceae bacterium]
MSKEPNYIRKVAAEHERQGLKPGLHHVSIKHDDWCDHLKGGVCNCDPDVSIVAHKAVMARLDWLRRKGWTQN